MTSQAILNQLVVLMTEDHLQDCAAAMGLSPKPGGCLLLLHGVCRAAA